MPLEQESKTSYLKGLDDFFFFWSTSKMKDDVWKETEEFHSCFQSATFELLHCEQYFLLEMLVGFLIKYCHKKYLNGNNFY